MSNISLRGTTLLVLLALCGLTSCSTSTTVAGAGSGKDAGFYWSAAKETFAAGDYNRTADHLERVIEGPRNEYRDRAIPWYLMMTSGMAGAYIELADYYTAGARINKPGALEFHRKANDYRTIASKIALRFAQKVDQLNTLPLGAVPLGFPLPRGNAALPPAMKQISRGIVLTTADADATAALNVERSVLLGACMVSGAPNDVAKLAEILGRTNASTTRAIFGAALAKSLDTQAGIYVRNKLDDPKKLSIFKERAQAVLAEANRASKARIVPAQVTLP